MAGNSSKWMIARPDDILGSKVMDFKWLLEQCQVQGCSYWTKTVKYKLQQAWQSISVNRNLWSFDDQPLLQS